MKYEVVVSIYEKGKEDSLAEETILETDSLADAEEIFDELTAEDEETEEEAEEEAEEEEAG